MENCTKEGLDILWPVTEGMRKAKVALARKLAVVLHQMLVSGTAFNPTLAAAARP
jgi:hypothetical protein